MGVDLIGDDLVRVRQEHPTPTLEPATPKQAAQAWSASLAATPPTDLGTCVRCHQRPARLRCVNCQRAVCLDDAWTMLGLCKECLTPDEMRTARQGGHLKRPDLGIKWIED